MANNADLNIVLRLLDQASSGIKKVNEDLKKGQEDLGKESEKTSKKGEEGTKKHKDALLKARDAVKQFHKEMFVLALALAAVAGATNEWAQRNEQARTSVDNITLAFKNGLAKIGQFFSPITNALGDLAAKFNNSVGVGLSDGFERARIALKNFDDDLKNISNSFLVGEISAQRYFDLIIQKSNTVIAVNRQAQTALQEIATLESQINNKSFMEAQRLSDERIRLLNEYKTNYMIAHQGMAAFTARISESIRTNLTSALTGIITGAKTAKEAFAELGQLMIQTIVEFMVQKLVAWALEKTLLAGTVLATSTAATAIAAAWAPAAFLATVATLGAAAGGAPAALAASAAATAGILPALSAGLSAGASANVVLKDSAGASGFTKTFHDGGMIRAHSGLAVDEVPIIAQTGEGILSRRGMSALGGTQELNRLNKGQGSSSGGSVEVNVYYPKMSTMDEVKKLANALGLEIERQLRYGSA